MEKPNITISKFNVNINFEYQIKAHTQKINHHHRNITRITNSWKTSMQVSYI